jgi:hypothetical protein
MYREQTPLLYPVTREGSHDPHFAVDSSNDADAVDYTVHPAAAALTGWQCTLEAGTPFSTYFIAATL